MPNLDDAGDRVELPSSEEYDSTVNNLPFSPHRVLSMCFVQLDLIQAVNVVTEKHWNFMKTEHISCWLSMLKEVSTFASEFNKDLPLRVHLLNSGFMRMLRMSDQRRPPSLLNQESQAISVYLKILIRFGSRPVVEDGDDHLAPNVDEELSQMCAGMRKRYLNAEQKAMRREQ